MDSVLVKLKLHELNSGVFVAGNWLKSTEQVSVLNPTNNTKIAKTTMASIEQMDFAIKSANDVAGKWALVPAPKRGELIYQIGGVLREIMLASMNVLPEPVTPNKVCLANNSNPLASSEITSGCLAAGLKGACNLNI